MYPQTLLSRLMLITRSSQHSPFSSLLNKNSNKLKNTHKHKLKSMLQRKNMSKLKILLKFQTSLSKSLFLLKTLLSKNMSKTTFKILAKFQKLLIFLKQCLKLQLKPKSFNSTLCSSTRLNPANYHFNSTPS